MSTTTDRWLLPDGIGEVLPEQARQVEALRRRLLDLYHVWGYELVIPPLLEFTESLLLDTNKDLDLQTFKMTDQLSGRTMGVRADITPQAARIDAHSLNRRGPVRLCYADSVLHTRPANALASRSPIQVGVECFGVTGLAADIEVVSLMVESLSCANIKNVMLSLGHVEIFRALCEQAPLDKIQAEFLFNLLQRKASKELEEFVTSEKLDKSLGQTLVQLINFNGDISVLAGAEKYFSAAPKAIGKAIRELEKTAQQVKERYPDITLHIDLADLPGYHYHNGIVFAAYAEGFGSAIANGGRYDAVEQLFGRTRTATGFNADLKKLINIGVTVSPVRTGILVYADETIRQWEAIRELRRRGERVVSVASDQPVDAAELFCDRKLVREKNIYVIKPL